MDVTVLGDGLAACVIVATLIQQPTLTITWVTSSALLPTAPIPGVFLAGDDATAASRLVAWVTDQAQHGHVAVELAVLPVEIEVADTSVAAAPEPAPRMGILDISALSQALRACITQAGVSPHIAPHATFVWDGNQVVGLTLDGDQSVASDQLIWATGVDVQQRFRKTALDPGRHGARVLAQPVSTAPAPPRAMGRWMQARYLFPFAGQIWSLDDPQLLNTPIINDEPFSGVPLYDGIAWTAQRTNPGLILVGISGGEGLLALPRIASQVVNLLDLEPNT